ncbi:MAG: branched-chain amino acid ABC transporter permease [Bacillota bacterium]
MSKMINSWSQMRYFKLLIIAVVLVGLILLGLFSASGFLSLLIIMIIYSIYALAYDLLLGYANQPSLGHSLFFGLGAYGMVLPVLHWEWGFWAALGMALLAGAVGGLVVGFLAVRVTEAYHVILTALIASVVFLLAKNATPLTGGSGGLSFNVPPVVFGPVKLSVYDPETNFFLVLAFGLAVYLFLRRLVGTPLGRIWVGIRENENRMVSLGYNVYYYKLAAFIAASMLTALAGALYAVRLRYVSAEFFDFMWSVLPFIWVIVGGIGTLAGPIVGVVLFTVFQIYVSDWWTHYLILFGVLILAVLRWAPKGVMGYVNNWLNTRNARVGDKHGGSSASHLKGY